MSNHFSADNLKFPGDDRRLDLTDVFVFQAPASPEHHHTLLHRHHPGTTVLIMDSNPTSAPPPIPAPVTGPEFYPGAVYRINIDTDGDNQADVAFTFVFSEYENGSADRDRLIRHRRRRPASPSRPARCSRERHPGQLRRHGPARPGRPDPAVRRAAQRPVLRRRRRRPARLRLDRARRLRRQQRRLDRAGGTRRHARRPGHRRVGLDQPATSNGVLEQLDRGGNPTINPFINPDGEKNLFNSRQPADDVANYLGPWSAILQNAGGYTPEAGQGGRPAGAARHPALRPHQARHLPQRPHTHRRRLQHALRLADQRQGPPVRPQAARRPAGPVPLPRPAQPSYS